MARVAGFRYFHVAYEPEPDEEGKIRVHDLYSGNECWCEPQCCAIGKHTILVIHDPEDGLFVIQDKGLPTGPIDDNNPFRPR